MPKSNIVKELNSLSAKDIYSMVLFALYKLKDNPQYSTLSELVYVLDKNSLFNFLSVFEGLTIKVPKLSELQEVIYGLMLFSLVHIQNVPYDQAFAQVYMPTMDKEALTNSYTNICSVIDLNDFKREGNHE